MTAPVHVIVQARGGSNRLPAKVLEDIGGKPALLWCLDRCQHIEGAYVVVAVSEAPDSDAVADLAWQAGYKVVRGSDHDVLSRTAKAARDTGAEFVMRVTSDCPLIDPRICNHVIETFFRHKADYACNNMPPSWPHGLDCELMPASLLHQADAVAQEGYEREHVTPWIRRHADLNRVNFTGPGGMLARLRWTLDYGDDLRFFRALVEAMGPARAEYARAAELASLCLRRPDILGINAHKVDLDRLAQALRPTFATRPCKLAA